MEAAIRSAAAAAAEERLLDEDRELRKAWEAALCAESDSVAFRGGCI